LHRLDWVRSRRPCSTAWRWTLDWWDRWNSEINLKFQLGITKFSWYWKCIANKNFCLHWWLRIELIFENLLWILRIETFLTVTH
jgi:hypothetical protein